MSPDESDSRPGQVVGAKIRAARRAMKLTQNQLARPDFSVSYISAIERGQIQPSLRALAILAARLGLSTTQLLAEQAADGVVHSHSLHKLLQRQEAIELVFLEAEVSLQQGEALQAGEQLQQIATKNLKRRQQAQLQYLLGWAYLQMAQFEESKNALLEAARFAKDPGVFSSLNLQIMNMLGNMYAATHNYTEALGSYQQCLDLLASDHQRDPLFMIQVYTNKGECYMRLNQMEQAVKMFQQAAGLTEELASAEQLRSTYAIMCHYHAKVGEYELAALHGEKCLYLYGQEARLRARGELYHRICRAVMDRDQEQARAFLEAALQRESEGWDSLSVASITLNMAAWYLAHDRVAEAKEYAWKAYEGARPFEETIIAAEALLLLGQIAYAESRDGAGDARFADGLAMLKRLGMREELAEGLVRYAQLLEDRGRPEEALRYWKQAFEIRQKSTQTGEVAS